MEKLIDQMFMDMKLQNYSPKTIKQYMWHIRDFSKYFQHYVEDLKEDDIRKYLYYIKEEKEYSLSYLSQAFSAIRFLYREIIQMPIPLTRLKGPKPAKKLPIVLTQEEVKKLFESIENPKHQVMLMTTYSGGLRVSETAHLKITDIDSGHMHIRVEQGKGRKDRYTILSKHLLKRLREYWLLYRPHYWLFPSIEPSKPISASAIQRVFRKAKKKPESQSQLLSIPFAIVLQPTF
jgi:integrase/recombinase XerD